MCFVPLSSQCKQYNASSLSLVYKDTEKAMVMTRSKTRSMQKNLDPVKVPGISSSQNCDKDGPMEMRGIIIAVIKLPVLAVQMMKMRVTTIIEDGIMTILATVTTTMKKMVRMRVRRTMKKMETMEKAMKGRTKRAKKLSIFRHSVSPVIVMLRTANSVWWSLKRAAASANNPIMMSAMLGNAFMLMKSLKWGVIDSWDSNLALNYVELKRKVRRI